MHLKFLSSGCNSHPNSASLQPFVENPILAYSSKSSIYLYDPRVQKNISSSGIENEFLKSIALKSGSKTILPSIQCIKWLDSTALVSGDSDGNFILWELVNVENREDGVRLRTCAFLSIGSDLTKYPSKYHGIISEASPRKAAIHHISTLSIRDGNCSGNLYLVGCCHANGLFAIHQINLEENSMNALQIIKINREKRLFYPMCSDWSFMLSHSSQRAHDTCELALAIGGTDNNIHVYSSQIRPENFSKNEFPVFRDEECDPGYPSKCVLKGHTDWIRELRFSEPIFEQSMDKEEGTLKDHPDKLYILLASASQDKYIRLWKFRSKRNIIGMNMNLGVEQEAFIQENDEDIDWFGIGVQYNIPKPSNNIVTLDAVLMGHEDCVWGLYWAPKTPKYGGYHISSDLELLSCSMDKTLIIWRPNITDDSNDESYISSVSGGLGGMWINVAQIGDLGGETFGIYNALWYKNLKSDKLDIITTTYHGAIQHYVAIEDEETGVNSWNFCGGITGHYDSVRDAKWDPTGSYLLTVSLDQTCRAWAPIDNTLWYELSRSQVHGYDLHSLAFFSPFEYASGSEGEKVLRTFRAPHSFLKILKKFSVQPISKFIGDEILTSEKADGAILPALGLSNKQLNAELSGDNKDYSIFQKTPENALVDEITNQYIGSFTQKNSNHNFPPSESRLHLMTLWPETDKLYGHGDEIFVVESDLNNSSSKNYADFFISTCVVRASSISSVNLSGRDSMLLGWQVSSNDSLPTDLARDAAENVNLTCKAFGKQFESPHSMTITCASIKKMHDGSSILLTGSRDRSWAIWKIQNKNTEKSMDLISKCRNAHSRLIWSCCWVWNGEKESQYFFTASRDGLIKCWQYANLEIENNSPDKSESIAQLSCSLDIGESQTAICSLPDRIQERMIPYFKSNATANHYLMSGSESGKLYILGLHKLENGENTMQIHFEIPNELCPANYSINRVVVRPESPTRDSVDIAVAASDGSVRVLSI